MSYHKRIEEWLWVNRPDVTLAKVGLILSIVLLILRLMATQVLLLVIPLASGLGCLLYLLINEPRSDETDMSTLSGQPLSGWLPTLVLGVLTISVLLVTEFGGRPWPVLLLTGGIGTLLIIQILFADGKSLETSNLLVQIVLVSVSLRLAALFVTPGYIGVDIWSHAPVYVSGIAQAGDLSPLSESKYLMAPIYHIFGATATSLVTDTRLGIYLTLGVLIPISCLFVFSTANLIVSSRWALLATVLYAFSDQFIRWGLHIIPTSLGLVLFLATVYLVTLGFVKGLRWESVLLLAAYSLAIVFIHQVTTAIYLVFLAIATAVSFLTDNFEQSGERDGFEPVSWSLFGVFGLTLITTVISWVNTPYGGSSFLANRFDIIAAATRESRFLDLAGESTAGVAGPAATRPAPTTLDVILPYIEQFGFVILLGITVLGGLVMIGWHRRTKVRGTLLLTAVVFFVIVFGFSLFGIRVFLPGRWIAFLYLPMAIVAAIGFSYAWRHASRPILVALVILMAVGYPTSMVIAKKATLDDPSFEEQYVRFSYTEAELAAVETINEIRPPESYPSISTDHPYRTVYGRVGGYDSRILVMNESGPVGASAIIYRDYQREGLSEFHTINERSYPLTQGTVQPAWVCPSGLDYVYQNDEIILCVESSMVEERS